MFTNILKSELLIHYQYQCCWITLFSHLVIKILLTQKYRSKLLSGLGPEWQLHSWGLICYSEL